MNKDRYLSAYIQMKIVTTHLICSLNRLYVSNVVCYSVGSIGGFETNN